MDSGASIAAPVLTVNAFMNMRTWIPALWEHTVTVVIVSVPKGAQIFQMHLNNYQTLLHGTQSLLVLHFFRRGFFLGFYEARPWVVMLWSCPAISFFFSFLSFSLFGGRVTGTALNQKGASSTHGNINIPKCHYQKKSLRKQAIRGALVN